MCKYKIDLDSFHCVKISVEKQPRHVNSSCKENLLGRKN